MICPDFFDNYIKIFDFKKHPDNKIKLDDYLIEIIKNRDNSRINKIKQYVDIGFDINENISKQNYNWLEFSVYTNDIPLIGFLIKSCNVNIHRININGSNIIHICIETSNSTILKYFL